MIRLTTLLTLVALSLSAAAESDHIAKALAHSDRFETDVALDEMRHPDAVLEFFGITPGMAVFDIFAGGGYYTEILHRVVGAEGRVVHYNNKPWADFVKKATDRRFADDRLAGVEQLVATPESLAGSTSEFDAAIFILGMHDIYYADPATGWVAIDKDKFIKGMHDLLKPGGMLGIIDHNAAAGTDPEIVGKSVHRIDPAILIADLEAAGFELEAQSDLLANAEDDKSTSVFLPENRFKTDRSLLRFRKSL